MEKPIVYLVGKISEHGWREELLGGAISFDDAEDPDLFNPAYTVDCGTFRYGGPFFISCDHGCYHRPAGHGAAEGCMGITAARSRIFEINRRRLANADFVFAYINETDCYGTLIELGMAVELDKHITVVFGPALAKDEALDLWMANMCSSGRSLIWPQMPAVAWREFLRDHRLALAVVA